jgi:hypothetical protein
VWLAATINGPHTTLAPGLQLYLWRPVADEAGVHQLLEEALGSALHRSLEQPPVLMVLMEDSEPSTEVEAPNSSEVSYPPPGGAGH